MISLISLAKAVCGKHFAGFFRSRQLAKLGEANELIRRQKDHPSDDPRMGGGVPMIGIL